MTCIRCMRTALVLGCLLALLGGDHGNIAEARGEPGPIREVRDQLRAKLHDMAKYCTSRKLFGARYDVYELVIEIWPEDEAARKSNGYTDTGSGWSKEGRKRPRNLSASGMPALKALQDETATWYMQAIAEATRELPPGMAAAWRARSVGTAARIAPTNEELRAKNGEVKGKGADGKRGWILVESQNSRKRRKKLLAAGQKALKSAPKPKKDTARDFEKSSTVNWTTVIKGKHGRLTGTTEPAELAQILRNVDATFPFFDAAFGRTPAPIPGLTIHVVDNIGTGNVYLGDQKVDQQWLRFVTPLIACWVPKTNRVMVKSPDAETRLEAAPRQVNAALMSRRFNIHSKMGWAVEGFGLYLTWHIAGTRRINSVRESQYGEQQEKVDLAKRLKETETDWVAEARALVNGPHAPDLRLLLGKTVNTMTPEDILYSYALAMWLTEGHRDKLGGFLPAVAGVKDADFDLAFAEHLGFDVASAERRVKRWLNETADLPGH